MAPYPSFNTARPDLWQKLDCAGKDSRLGAREIDSGEL